MERVLEASNDTLIVITNRGDVFGAVVFGVLGEVFQFSGAKIDLNTHACLAQARRLHCYSQQVSQGEYPG
jgi:hypothetical protein